jgi:hypothetical protein
MIIEQKSAPNQISPANAKANPQASTPRDRAIAKILEGAANTQQAPVSNPSNVSPEEIGALRPNLGQSNSNEAPTSSEPEAAPKAPEEPISSQYAILAKKEKALRLRDQQMKAKEAEIRAREEALRPAAPKAPEFDPSKYVAREELTKDPFSVLADLGLSYDQLTEMALNAPKAQDVATRNEIASLKAELAAIKGAQEKTNKSLEEQSSNSYKQALTQIRRDVTDLVTNDPYFETVAKTGSVSDVVELIERTFNEEGVLLSVEQAAKEVEDHLVDQLTSYTSRIDKIKKRLQPQASTQAAPKQETNKQPQLKTLTNSVSSSRKLNARERAIAAMEGRLNK